MSSLLIVDDDRSIRRIVQRCLEDSDVKVHTATSGPEAARATAALQSDVVVPDSLPDGSGLSALEEIRRLNPSVRHTCFAIPTVINPRPRGCWA